MFITLLDMKNYYYVYITTNKSNKVLYVGYTNSIRRRIAQHKNKESNFTQRYTVDKLVYFRIFKDGNRARTYERRLKQGSRASKLKLVQRTNPNWVDLYDFLDDSFILEYIKQPQVWDHWKLKLD